jgi:Leucine-rich repeat (LRR) protein
MRGPYYIARMAKGITDDGDKGLWLHGGRKTDRHTDDEVAAFVAELPELQVCDWENQLITRLPARGMTKVTKLELKGCTKLASLAGIEDMVRLQKLSIEGATALDLDAACGLLAELPELAELSLTVDSVPAGIAKLASLIQLELHVAKTASIARLAKLPSLRRLELIGGKQEELANLPKLEALILYTTSVPDEIGKLANLEELEIHGATSLPASIGKLAKLRKLDLKATEIAALPDELCACAALEELDVSSHELRALPAQIGKLAKLRVFRGTGRRLGSLPESFGDLANLRDLSLSRLYRGKFKAPKSFAKLSLETYWGPEELQAELAMRDAPTPDADEVGIYEAERVPADLGDPFELALVLDGAPMPLPQLAKLKRLKKLRLDTGDLAGAFANLAGAPNLTELTLVGEREAVPEELGLLSRLESLHIDACNNTYTRDIKLVKLPKAIGKLAKLRELSILTNSVEAFPAEIGNLAALESLRLEMTAATELPALGKLQALTSLMLRDSKKLASLPASIARCAKLAKVEIHDATRIGNLEILAKLPALRELEINSLSPKQVAKMVDALGGSSIETLVLGGKYERGVAAMPASIGKLAKLRSLEFWGSFTTLPASLRALGELRRLELPFSQLEGNVKAMFPPGRWKKNRWASRDIYSRAD